MPPSIVKVEEISFFPAEPGRALPLIQRESVRVTSPEWTAGGPAQPCAYALHHERTIQILATFSCADPARRRVKVQAVRRGPDLHAIGGIADTVVTFDAAGRSQPTLFDVQVRAPGVDIGKLQWQWQFRDGSDLIGVDESEHDVAITLGPPQAPWCVNPTPVNQLSFPWWEVLQWACLIARGSTSTHQATTKIAEMVYRCWDRSVYEWDSGAQEFASNAGADDLRFDCGKFLRLLNAQPVNGVPAPSLVDCSDIAAIVSTFAAILGCPIAQVSIDRGLRCNPIRLVGHRNWTLRETFGMHEFAFEGTVAGPHRIWDGCLELSADLTINRDTEPRTSRLPVDVQESDYMQRLIFGPPEALSAHLHTGPLTRFIGPLSTEFLEPEFSPYLKDVAERYRYSEWMDPGQILVEVPAFNFEAVHLDDWRVGADPDSTKHTLPGARVRLSRALLQHHLHADALAAADVYLCASPRIARKQTVVVLGRFTTPTLKRMETPAQSVEFQTPDGTSIVQTFFNVVLVVRRASPAKEIAGMAVRQLFTQIGKAVSAAARAIPP